MTSGFINNWHRVWSNRSQPTEGSVLERLIALDGFDSPLGYMAESDWRAYLAVFAGRAGIAKGDSIFEVGCGGGAFLYPFYEEGYTVGGIDYSRELVAIARSAMPDLQDSLQAIEACECPATPAADVVIANHVIHYFPSTDYTAAVVDRMLEKANRTVAISGIPNATLRADSERERRGLLTPAAYESKYHGLEIVYYKESWFARLATRHGFSAQFFAHEMPGFAQNKFRFDCIMTRS